MLTHEQKKNKIKYKHIRFVRRSGHATRRFHTMDVTVFPSYKQSVFYSIFSHSNDHTSHNMHKHYGDYYILCTRTRTYIIAARRRLFYILSAAARNAFSQFLWLLSINIRD